MTTAPKDALGGDWIAWAGGENPVPDQMVYYQMLGYGTELNAPSDHLRWTHDFSGIGLPSLSNIIAYRLADTIGSGPSGDWRDQSLTRLARVRAHRIEFGSDLKTAVDAVDAETDRQLTAARRIAHAVTPRSVGTEPEGRSLPDPNPDHAELLGRLDNGVTASGGVDCAPDAITEAAALIRQQSAALARKDAALRSIAEDDQPELGNRNINDLTARMYWNIARQALETKDDGAAS